MKSYLFFIFMMLHAVPVFAMDNEKSMGTSNRYIEFEGIGAVDPTITNRTQRRSLSESAGRKIAEEKMLAYLENQKIDPTNVKAAIDPMNKRRKILSGTLRGVAVVKREWTKEDNCIVTIRLNKKKLKILK